MWLQLFVMVSCEQLSWMNAVLRVQRGFTLTWVQSECEHSSTTAGYLRWRYTIVTIIGMQTPR
jgi:hypothetical protein